MNKLSILVVLLFVGCAEGVRLPIYNLSANQGAKIPKNLDVTKFELGQEIGNAPPLQTPKRAVRGSADSVFTGWYIQTSAEKSATVALSKLSEIRAKELPAVIQRAVVDDSLFYRVLVGPYSQKHEAEDALGVVGEDGFVKHIQ